MKLPNWVPKVNRPWNPTYVSTWDAMSDNEKRWSFLIDVIIVTITIGIIIICA